MIIKNNGRSKKMNKEELIEKDKQEFIFFGASL